MTENIIYIVGLILKIAGGAIALFFIFVISKNILTHVKRSSKPQDRSLQPVEGGKVPDDRLALVRNTTGAYIDRVLKDFCKLYDEKRVCLRMTEIAPDEFVVECPRGIDFDTFCILVNYLVYPEAAGERMEVRGWTTAEGSDPMLAGRQIMLYVPVNDREYDNVYITHENGGCYKFDFGGRFYKLPEPVEEFRPRPVYSADDLAGKPTVEYN